MFKILLAQINTCVGDIDGNRKQILDCLDRGRKEKADVVVFPELTVTGYPPKDLLMKQRFIHQNTEALHSIIPETRGITAVLGFVDVEHGRLFNAAAVIHDGELIGIQHKIHLPNYDVFDEKRYFKPGTESRIFSIRGVKTGVNICEDIWAAHSPVEIQAGMGAELIINISASPFHLGKIKERRDLISAKAAASRVPICYCNLIGGQDDLVFDGMSYAVNKSGAVIKSGAHFSEDHIIVDSFEGDTLDYIENVPQQAFEAIKLGIRDYAHKNNFQKTVIGLSGGIDSALTATLAAEALGPENVLGILMPGPYSSKGSLDDAEELAKNLNIKTHTIPISGAYESFKNSLSPVFEGTQEDIAEENIQARVRGTILMGISNKFNYLVLTTGNKSELAVGYCTLYGDMAGGLAAISDLPKTMVYKVARHINESRGKDIIPVSTLTKPPSAELKPDQTDQDSLPPYDTLDQILHLVYRGKQGG